MTPPFSNAWKPPPPNVPTIGTRKERGGCWVGEIVHIAPRRTVSRRIHAARQDLHALARAMASPRQVVPASNIVSGDQYIDHLTEKENNAMNDRNKEVWDQRCESGIISDRE